MFEGAACGVLIAVVGGYLCQLVGKMVEGWELNRIANRAARRKASGKAKATS